MFASVSGAFQGSQYHRFVARSRSCVDELIGKQLGCCLASQHYLHDVFESAILPPGRPTLHEVTTLQECLLKAFSIKPVSLETTPLSLFPILHHPAGDSKGLQRRGEKLSLVGATV